MPAARDDDNGSGSVWVLALMLSLALVAVAASAAAAGLALHARAAAAADLAALAAADRLQRNGTSGDACGAAQRIATENRATLDSCVVHGQIAVVAVSCRWPSLRPLIARATARAGPV